MTLTTDGASLYERPAELLQQLIRFDTTNPPGNEAACVGFIDELLKEAGIETTLLARAPGRPNLVARLKGRGSCPPVLLYGHVDVVTTAGQAWHHAPFGGEIEGGFIWGRGALDMKGGVAMMLSAFLRAKAAGAELPGDVILALVTDEEAGGDDGARFLVEAHAALFKGARYAIGEFGGFTLHLGNRRVYPIAVAEKQMCSLKATVRGPAGHGSMPLRGGAMSKLAALIQCLEKQRLPVHITPAAKIMLDGMAAAAPAPINLAVRGLLNPALTDRTLDALGPQGRTFDPLLHNTACPTMVHGGDKINVIPCEISLGLDGRLLPGFKPEDLLAELRERAGDDVTFEVERYDPGPAEPDMGWFDTLAGILREGDPEGIAVPFMLSGVTDGRFFSRLGIQTYGYLPMRLPASFDFIRTIHAADERIPVEAVAFGADAIYKALQRAG
jgi:acetylornithine deacetylase/succinyl-diaminopimelate desuccinylase-like protein